MKVYDDGFIQAMKEIEENVEKTIYDVAEELNRDFMIDCRNLSIGDSNQFGDMYVMTRVHKINIENEIYSREATVDKIGEMVAKKVRAYILENVTQRIYDSKIKVEKIGDVRKAIKVALFTEAIFDFRTFDIVIKMGATDHIEGRSLRV